jgi:U3 small nucleolar RNA-associated protein 18
MCARTLSAPLTGSQYEAALRKQHASLNPRTGWASRDAAAAAAAAKRGRRSGFGADSEDEEEHDQQAGPQQQEGGPEGLEGLMQRAGGLLGQSRGGGGGRGVARLPPGSIETARMKDANQHAPHEAVVQSVEFHPSGQLLMTAGLDKRVRLFQVDGVRNPRWGRGGGGVVFRGERPTVSDLDGVRGGRLGSMECGWLCAKERREHGF